MKCLFYTKINDKIGRITTVHNFPETISEEELKQGIVVDNYHEPKEDGKFTIGYINLETKEIYFEYEDIPKAQEDLQQEKIKELEQQLLEVQQYIIDKEEKELLEKGEM
ncbi:hypothetical protein [Clostridium butanoliproducens]|uniref:hypothetical protein n=1 Tax=Clostridium butanoliproducens TaxID=2991837 RepID=UPI0024B8F802|nr:hypothetical protein [Clostridium butanoliproducens]